MHTSKRPLKKGMLTTCNLRGVPVELWMEVRLHAAKHNRTIRETILDALREYLDRHP